MPAIINIANIRYGLTLFARRNNIIKLGLSLILSHACSADYANTHSMHWWSFVTKYLS